MRRSTLIYVGSAAALALVAATCSQEGPSVSNDGSGGSSSQSGSGGHTQTSGTGGNEGNDGTGGMQGPNGTGGQGTGGTQGPDGTGGMTNQGSGGGNGNPGTGGRASGSGGMAMTGSGGRAAGSGGMAMGTGGRAGTGGTPGTGGMTATVTPQTLVPALYQYMWIGTCSNGTASGLDCPLNEPITGTTCPNANASDWNMRGAIRTVTIPVMGTTGQNYTINFEARGVLGTKCYQGGQIRTNTLISDVEGSTGNDGWYVGGTPIESLWNTYEIHVDPPMGSSATSQVYYMNAFPNASGYCEKHETFVMKYMASLPVIGGGQIRLVLHDSNCLGQQNCGAPDSQPTCASPRTVSLAGLTTQPTGTFAQPYTQSNGFHPQWVYFDLKSVTSP